MAVYVDDADIEYNGKIRCHMTADSKAELHDFAESIGVKRCWYHKGKSHPHYDITIDQKQKAIQLGAIEIDQRDLLQVCKQLIEQK